MDWWSLLGRLFAPSVPVFGIPFTIIWPVVLIFVWWYGRKGRGLVVVLIISMLLHEAAHAVAAGLLGEQIVGAGFGGYFAYVRVGRAFSELNPFVNIGISLAGPAINLLLGWGFKLYGFSEYSRWNFRLGYGNLIPFFPLDGYRALMSLLVLFSFSRETAGFIISLILFLILFLGGEIAGWLRSLLGREKFDG